MLTSVLCWLNARVVFCIRFKRVHFDSTRWWFVFHKRKHSPRVKTNTREAWSSLKLSYSDSLCFSLSPNVSHFSCLSMLYNLLIWLVGKSERRISLCSFITFRCSLHTVLTLFLSKCCGLSWLVFQWGVSKSVPALCGMLAMGMGMCLCMCMKALSAL